MVHKYSLYFYSELYNDVATDPRAKYHTPVILMEGVNHGQFASGRMPSNVATHDLPPDVTNTTAYQRIANYTCSFSLTRFATIHPHSGFWTKGSTKLTNLFR